jgi:hypothetical protein
VDTEGSVRLYRLVWGICIMLAAGFLGVSMDFDYPWGGILAAVFGAGAGLTMDEFALWTRSRTSTGARRGARRSRRSPS